MMKVKNLPVTGQGEHEQPIFVTDEVGSSNLDC
jgi:hypothetical protein